MRRHHWFAPGGPDVLALLREQMAITNDGMEAMLRWARGDVAAAEEVRQLEQVARDRKRALRSALTEVFAPPLDPEDLFTLSEGVDEILNHARNTVREAEVMDTRPDVPMAEMVAALHTGADRLAEALADLADAGASDRATDAADRAIACQREVEHSYRRAMSALVGLEDIGEVTARRELYRRLVRTGDVLEAVADRVWYAVLKRT